MRKLITAIAVCALAVGLTVAPSAIGKTKTKSVASTVTVAVTPSAITSTTPATIAASGNVQANSSCRKNRSVSLDYVNAAGATVPQAGMPVSTTTGPNGDFKVDVPKPTDATIVGLKATVAETIRTKTIKGKKKGANKGKKKGATKKTKFLCQLGTGQATLTVSP